MARTLISAALLLILLFSDSAGALDTVVSITGDDVPNLNNISDFVADVITRAGAATDREKAIALHNAVCELMPQSPGSVEPEASGIPVDDPIKLWNVYGFGFCSYDSHVMQACFRELGWESRSWEIHLHTITEAYFDDGSGINQPGWHIFDPAHERYYTEFPDGSGHIASRDDMLAEDGTDMPNNLIYCANYQDYYPGGRIPETNTPEGEYNMYTYDLVNGTSEDFIALGGRDMFYEGHIMDIPLKRGETLTRYYEPLGDTDDYWIGQGDGSGYPHWYLAGFDTSPKAYSNGVYEYRMPLDTVRYRDDIESEINIASVADDGLTPNLHLASVGTGSVVFAMRSPYITTSAFISGDFKRANPSDSISIYVSPYETEPSGGIDWGTAVWTSTGSDPVTVTDLSIKNEVRSYYTYLIKVEMSSSIAKDDVGINALTIENIIQCAPQSLPRLNPGSNTIQVETASQGIIRHNPVLSTNDVFDSAYRVSNVQHYSGPSYLGFVHPSAMDVTGELVYKFNTAGDIQQFTIGGAFYMHDGNEIEVAYSFDDTTYTSVIDDLYTNGYKPSASGYINENYMQTVNGIAPGEQELYVRYRFRNNSSGSQGSGAHAKNLIMNIYYAAPESNLDLQITYGWEDSGTQTDVEVVSDASHTYTVNTNAALDETFIQPPFITFNDYIKLELVESDSDGDGMPDSWEMQYFGDLDQDAGTDYDNDGYDDIDEYLAGTNPDDINDFPLPELAFSASGYTIDEGNAATIIVNRSGRTTDAVAVNYTLTASTAEGGDYSAANGTLNWGAGDMDPKSFDIITFDDADLDDEIISITLSNASPGETVIQGSTAVNLTILDDDADVAIDLTAVKDTLVNSSAAAYNYGIFNPVKVEGDNTSSLSAMLIEFDVSSIPAGAVITDAALKIYCDSDPQPGQGGIFTVHSMIQSWVEGTEDWGTAGTGASFETYDGANSWSGGSFDGSGNYNSTPAAALIKHSNSGSNPYYINSAPPAGHNWPGNYVAFDITDLVNDWVNNGLSNNGIAVRASSHTPYPADPDYFDYGSVSIRWDTRETSNPPILSIEYSAAGSTAAIQVDAPNGSETLIGGQQVTIRWSNTDFSDTVDIDYYNGTAWVSIAAGAANDESYLWTVPDLDISACLIRVADADDGSPSDVSDASFTVSVNSDGDGDGMDDDWEFALYGDYDHDGNDDYDGDGLSDLLEFQNGTDPDDTDSDNDGMNDFDEVDNGLNPLFNDAALDSDGDGARNAEEIMAGTDPLDANSVPSTKTASGGTEGGCSPGAAAQPWIYILLALGAGLFRKRN